MSLKSYESTSDETSARLIFRLRSDPGFVDGGTSITDRALEWVAEQPVLEELWLEQTEVSEAGLRSLLSLRTLRFISLVDTSVTVEGIETFRAALPSVEVHW